MSDSRKFTLGVLAAGMGSRYGGLKQVEPVYNDHILLEYSIYDAILSGFSKIAILIRRDFEELFMEKYGEKIRNAAGNFSVEVGFAFQDGMGEIPQFREKMWGTGEAVLRLGAIIDEPFAAINADDYYGRESFKAVFDFFNDAAYDRNGNEHALVGFQLENVLSQHGSVARGICGVSDDGYIEDIVERGEVYFKDGGIVFRDEKSEHTIAPDTYTSMNFWAFNPSIFSVLEDGFNEFTANIIERRDPKKEFYMSDFAGELSKQGEIKLKVLPTSSRWFGMTYREDFPLVIDFIRSLTDQEFYPPDLWRQ